MTRFTPCIIAILSIALCAQAQELSPKSIQWQAKDTAGKAVTVPAEKTTTVLLFVMASQDHSIQAMNYAQQVLAEHQGVQLIAIISGAQSPANAPEMIEKAQWKQPMVVDPDYDASGEMLVRVWPTTLVIAADGKLLAHIGGRPASYSKDLSAYLDFAAGKLDQAALEKTLAAHHVVGSTQTDIAKRHLQLAQRLMARGDFEPARIELEKGLKMQPDDAMLQLTLARVDLVTRKADEALKLVDSIPANQLPAWRLNAVRGRAMVALGQWDKARQVLNNAVALNPDPAEVHYALGLVYEHEKDFTKAAEAFKLAFETSESGKALAIPLK